MSRVSISEARANLSSLIARACQGEEIIIRGPKGAVRLVPIPVRKQKRKPGALRDKIDIGPSFFDPLPPDELPE